MNNIVNCPCSPNKAYADCCLPFHQKIKLPNNAEQLMRSRYSAYVLNLTDYISETWHPTTRPSLAQLTAHPVQWIKLTINKTWQSLQADEAFVDFDAFYEANGQFQKMHEVSRFVFINNRWFYIDGKVSE